jgi:hypothetical protein
MTQDERTEHEAYNESVNRPEGLTPEQRLQRAYQRAEEADQAIARGEQLPDAPPPDPFSKFEQVARDATANPPTNGAAPDAPLATLEAIVAMGKARRAKPNHEYVEPDTGLKFVLRELTGTDMDHISSWAGNDEDRYAQIMAETSSVSPKIDMLLWSALAELAPMVRPHIMAEVRRISGIRVPGLDVPAPNDSVTVAKNA